MRQAAVILVLLLLLIVSCVLISAPPYIEKSFTVNAGAQYTIAVDLKAGQTVEGYFSISGEENDIDFYITDSSGGLVYSEDVEGSHEFAVEAKDSGIHTLWFDNSFSWEKSREVTLHYRSR